MNSTYILTTIVTSLFFIPQHSNADGGGDVVLEELSSDDEDEAAEDEADGEDASPPTLGDQILARWEHRKVNLDHDYAITGWMLCVMPAVRADVEERLQGHHREAAERVIERLHLPPCPNRRVNIDKMAPSDIVDKFWSEYKDFSNKTGVFSKAGRWSTHDVIAGRSSAWHEKYSLDFTDVLGFVACRVTCKNLGIGAAERAWAGTKDIKDGKRAGLGGESTEKRSILYMSARISEARVLHAELEKLDAGPNAMFSDDDIK